MKRRILIYTYTLVFPIALFAQVTTELNRAEGTNLIRESTISKPAGYSISGHVAGLIEGEKVTMILFNSKAYHNASKYFTYADSAYVTNGEFHLKGFVPEGPRRYFIAFDRHNSTNNTRFIDLWIDNNEQISIRCDSNIERIPHNLIQHYVEIEGSPTNYSAMCLEPARALYYQTLAQLSNSIGKIHDSIGFNGSLVEGIISARNTINEAFYVKFLYNPENDDPEIGKANVVFLPLFNPSGHASFWMDWYKSLDERRRNSFHGRWLKEIAILSIGQPFPEFSLPTPEGKNLELRDIVTKSKITVVHFWSANSTDRKKNQDEVRAMYRKYHDKGLNVIGLFHDDSYDKRDKYESSDLQRQWKDILDDEKYQWYNVADLRGKESIVEKVYREGGSNNTTNVLIDEGGKIIAWDVKGSELQYYLWKTFKE